VTVTSDTRPLAAALERACALGEYFSAELGPPDAGSLRVGEIPSVLPEQLRRGAEALGTDDRRIAAAMFAWRYAWRLAAPAIACHLTSGRAPDVGPENVAVGFDETGTPLQPVFLSSRHAAAAEGHEVLPWLRAGLEAHLTPVFAALHACSPLGARAPWALAADGCAMAFLLVGKELDEEGRACREAEAFLAGTGSLRSRASFFTLEHGGRRETFIRRASCCLFYHLPGETYCVECPLLSEAERERACRTAMEAR
jgi:ferric iron reductase protein FhuF